MEFKYGVILACLALTIFLIVKELRRTDKSRLLWRLVAAIFMVASFACLIIPITYSIKKEELAGELNLYTEKANHFIDLNYYLKENPQIKKINIYGYGLNDEELKVIKGYQISFHPLAIPSGIISVSWPKKIKAATQLAVQGVYTNSTRKPVKLKLFGLGANLDSVTIKPNARLNFSLTNLPKQIGKTVFKIIALQGKDTLSADPVPFEVENKQPISVLILASFPDFEYKFLKRWLFENQFQVAVRSQISKNKYSTEFLNRDAANLNQINQALLKNIDVVISDESELSPEIYKAVNNGMGLIIRAKPTDTTEKVKTDSRLNGMGKIVTTTVASTYQWQLAGKKVEYSRYWSLLFEKALRKKLASQSFEIIPQWPTVNEKARLTVNLSDTKAPVISIDSAKIAPRQNMELPFVWDGFFWPKAAGWTTLSINQKTESIYTYEVGDWNAAKKFSRLKTTENFVASQPKRDSKGDKIEVVTTEELRKWWFFVVFLAAISFLWYEKRFLVPTS